MKPGSGLLSTCGCGLLVAACLPSYQLLEGGGSAEDAAAEAPQDAPDAADADDEVDVSVEPDADAHPRSDFVMVKTELFWMGSPDGDCPAGYPGGEGTQCASELGRSQSAQQEELHHVTLSNSFEIMTHEVTQYEFETAMGWNPSTKSCDQGCGNAHPVYYANWFDAVAYANKLSTNSMVAPCYNITQVMCEEDDNPGAHDNYMACFDGSNPPKRGGIRSANVKLNGVSTPYECIGYRLPTEAEWEHATRAGSVTAFYPSKGNDGSITVMDIACGAVDPNLNQIGWYCANDPGTTSPVGRKAANAFGLYDMSGNVAEWVWDWYAVFAADAATDPSGPAFGLKRVMRGGGWRSQAGECRSAFRGNDSPSLRNRNVGFRLARSLLP